MKKILFITNGHGEDMVAAEMIKKLQGKAHLLVLPLVGEGKIFDNLEAVVIGSRKSLPSGGFSLRHPWHLLADLYAGLLGNTLEQLRILKELKNRVDLTVGIGDIVPIIGASRVKAPFVFVGVNKSSYYKTFGYGYTPWEKLMLQRHARKVFVRDKITEIDLRTRGIKIPNAEYVGNPLMDCLHTTAHWFEVKEQKKEEPTLGTQAFEYKTIGFLPGTRGDARINLEDFEKVTESLIHMKVPEIELKFLVATTLRSIPEYMERKNFPQLLLESDLVVGLSGTGNEQAAGSGLAVLSFYGRGSQYNKKFSEAQKQLLGDALYLVKDNDPLSVAAEIWHLLRNPDKMKAMGIIGMERMGSPGAVEKIVEYVLSLT